MIRILHIVTYMGRGGLETMLMNYYRYMPRQEIQFDFLVHRTFTADYDEEILSMGGQIYRFPRLVPGSLRYRHQLMTFLKAHPEYSIIHVHQDCLSSIALECAKQCHIPVRIAHSHISSQDKNWKYPVKYYYKQKIPFYATDFLACSRQAGEWMFRGHAFSILPNAIDAGKYAYDPEIAKAVRNSLNIDEQTCVVGHIGRFHPQKNHAFLIEVFCEFLKLQPKSILLLVGDGEGRKAIQKKIDHLGIGSYIRMMGVRSDIPELLQAMDVFIFPSLYEGLGISLIEAQASGLPCLISDSIPEDCIITRHLVEPYSLKNSPSMWAAKASRLLTIPRKERSGEIRKAGYNLPEAAKKLEDLYLQFAAAHATKY